MKIKKEKSRINEPEENSLNLCPFESPKRANKWKKD